MVVTYVSKRCYSCENEWANGQIMSYHTNNRTIPYHCAALRSVPPHLPTTALQIPKQAYGIYFLSGIAVTTLVVVSAKLQSIVVQLGATTLFDFPEDVAALKRMGKSVP